jgi:hypothetical protein
VQGEDGSSIPKHFHATIGLKVYLIGGVNSLAGSHDLSFGNTGPVNHNKPLQAGYYAGVLALMWQRRVDVCGMDHRTLCEE